MVNHGPLATLQMVILDQQDLDSILRVDWRKSGVLSTGFSHASGFIDHCQAHEML
jgi:hypothetical protein